MNLKPNGKSRLKRFAQSFLGLAALTFTQCDKPAENPPKVSSATPAPTAASENSVALISEGASPAFRAVASYLELGGRSYEYSETGSMPALAAFLDEILQALDTPSPLAYAADCRLAVLAGLADFRLHVNHATGEVEQLRAVGGAVRLSSATGHRDRHGHGTDRSALQCGAATCSMKASGDFIFAKCFAAVPSWIVKPTPSFWHFPPFSKSLSGKYAWQKGFVLSRMPEPS